MYQPFSLSKIGTMIISIMVILGSCATNGPAQPEEQAEQSAQAMAVSVTYPILCGILKMNGTFRETTENANIQLQFDFADENFAVLKSKYELEAIAGTGDDLSKALNLLFWLCEHTDHFGSYDNHVPMNALDLLEYAYDQGEKRGLNCLNLSYILTDCLLSIGLPAITVGIYPLSPYDADNHVVTHVYIAALDKWIMLDPTYNAYFKDADGNILNVVELRSLLADGKDVFLNDEISYNGERPNTVEVQYYQWYMAKNLFYFNTSEISGFGRDNDGRYLLVCPVGFNLLEQRIYNLEYRIKKVDQTFNDGDEASRKSYIESSTQRLENMKKLAQEGIAEQEYSYISLEDFLAKPDL